MNEKPNNGRRGIGYLRCSTAEQRESGLGLSAQRDAIESAAKRESITVAEWFTDEGVSGASTIDKRPGLVLAIDALGKGDVLLVAKRDRLARDTLMACWLETDITKRGARIVSAAGEGTDDDGPTSVLMRRIIDAFAEYERLMIRARTKAAMQVKRQRGERLGRFVQYGYRPGEGNKLEPVPHEQEAIALMLELRSKGMPLAKIGEELECLGFMARNGARLSAKVIRTVIQRAASARADAALVQC